MIAYKSLEEVLSKTIRWEEKLKDFYDVAEVALKNKKSREVVAVLRSELEKKLEVLKNVRPEQFGKTAWIRYMGDYDESDLLATDAITRDSSPQELFEHLERYESMLQSFYGDVASRLTNRSQKELFESLALYKSEQVAELKRLMRIHGER